MPFPVGALLTLRYVKVPLVLATKLPTPQDTALTVKGLLQREVPICGKSPRFLALI